jgi:tetratricopeptide (TPR) repeat protein
MIVDAHFSGLRVVIMEELAKAQSSILIAVAWFTDQSIYGILLKKVVHGVGVTVIVRNDVINLNPDSIDWQKLVDAGGKLYFSNIYPPLHHKFCIIDSSKVITGSYNWTYAAQRNHENITVLNKPSLVNGFRRAFIGLLIHSQRVESIKEKALILPPANDPELQLQSSFEVIYQKEIEPQPEDIESQPDDAEQVEESSGYEDLMQAAADATVRRLYQEAEGHLLKALRLMPDSLKAHEALANIYSKMQNFEAVLLIAQKAQARGLQSVDLWYAHGEALHELKRFTEAHLYFKLCDQERYLE